MLTASCIAVFLLSLFTTLSVGFVLVGLVVGFVNGYWLILISSVVGFLLQVLIRGASASIK